MSQEQKPKTPYTEMPTDKNSVQPELPTAETENDTNKDLEIERLKSQLKDKEIEELKARLDAMEKQIGSEPKRRKSTTVISPALTFVKRHWILLVCALLLVVAFITLMVCFVGVRGVYVNVNNPNDFYSFKPTSYKGYNDETGVLYEENGTWKMSNDKITFTFEDSILGKLNVDYVFSHKNGYKTIFIGEDKDNLIEYKRVSLLQYPLSKKIKIIFDANGGEQEKVVYSIKQGTKIESSTLKFPIREGYEFHGWYTTPYGYREADSESFQEEYRQWENITFYANWYNPTDYTISITGAITTTFTAKEGDLLLPLLQTLNSEENDIEYTFYLNDTVIDDAMRMSAKNISIRATRKNSFIKVNGGYSFSHYYGKDTHFTIPATYNGEAVVSIGDSAFKNCTSLTSITIPDSVTSIEYEAFKYCNNLTGVYITDLAKWCDINFGNVDSNPLYYAHKLYLNNELVTELIIPDSVSNIRSYAFVGCYGLTSITIGRDVTSIDNNAFMDCFKLVEVYNKSSLDIVKGGHNNGYVGYYAKEVYTTEYESKLSTTEDGYIIYTDGNTKSLIEYTGLETNLILPYEVTEINLFAFVNRSELTNVTIPNGVTDIGYASFYGCSKLTSIIIPDSVKSIGDYAFNGCKSLTSITFKGTTAQWKAISKGTYWKSNTSLFTVYCTDGNISYVNA